MCVCVTFHEWRWCESLVIYLSKDSENMFLGSFKTTAAKSILCTRLQGIIAASNMSLWSSEETWSLYLLWWDYTTAARRLLQKQRRGKSWPLTDDLNRLGFEAWLSATFELRPWVDPWLQWFSISPGSDPGTSLLSWVFIGEDDYSGGVETGR